MSKECYFKTYPGTKNDKFAFIVIRFFYINTLIFKNISILVMIENNYFQIQTDLSLAWLHYLVMM